MEIKKEVKKEVLKLRKKEISSKGIRFSLEENGKKIARAFLYLMKNDLHPEPFGFMEDVFVQEEFRGKGYGEKIVRALIEEARKKGCYKLICTSGHSRDNVHELYKKLGFCERGIEFRINFKK